MKYLKHIFTVSIAVASLVSCGKVGPITGPESGAIEFGAGIGSSVVQTKGDHEPGPDPDPNHAKHTLFTQGTKASVRMSGLWTGKGTVIKYTTATMGAETSKDSEHNLAPCDPVLFWDDFGSADIGNVDGRAQGLDIVAVAVDKETTAPAVGNDQWNAFPWALDVNQSEGWATKDLLVSNNVRFSSILAEDNAYKFDRRQFGKRLEFTHAMSKVTILLTAGEGFPVGAVSGVPEFQGVPEVSLLNFKYTGSVDIVGKVITPTSATADLTPAKYEGGAAHTANYNALVYPGNAFADNTNIIRIAVDGNVYYINATKINAVNTADDDVFEKGINYIIKATLNKTNINVSATISAWDDLESEEVEPVISIDTDWGKVDGAPGDGFTRFSFYRSLSLASGYSATLEKENGCIPAEAIALKPTAPETKWIFKNSSDDVVKLFWPTHNTHYQFRGVWPLTVTTTVGETPTAPHLETVNTDEAIKIYNTAYAAGSYPSDLLIGRPEFADPANTTCDNPDHDPVNLYNGGICATQGLVTLNFRYMMSQVEVLLSTTDEGSTDHVQLGENTVVEIVNVTNSEYAKIGDRTITTGTQASEYTLDPVSTAGLEGDDLVKAKLTRHSAIVPQPLTYATAGAETNLRFRITVTNSDSTKDIYYADVNPIKKKNSAEKIAPNGRWESGVHYLYNLKITKTEITVTATLTDWVTVEGNEDVWF